MPRPMTANDRRPERGDRLADGVPTYYHLPVVLHVEATRSHPPYFFGYNVNSDIHISQSWGVNESSFSGWHYLSRADGGPIIVEDAPKGEG